MAVTREIIERVEKINRDPTSGDIHSQVKTIAEAIVQIDTHHRQLEEKVSALIETVLEIFAQVKSLRR